MNFVNNEDHSKEPPFELNQDQCDIFFALRSNQPLCDSLQAFGKYLREPRSAIQPNTRAIPIKKEYPAWLTVCREAPSAEGFTTTAQGHIFSEVKLTRKWPWELTIGEIKVSFRKPSQLKFHINTLFKQFQVYSISPTGDVEEKLFLTQSEIDFIYKAKSIEMESVIQEVRIEKMGIEAYGINQNVGDEESFSRQAAETAEITQMHFTKEKQLPLSEFEDEGDNATTNVETQVNIHGNKSEESLYSGNDSEAARVAAHYEVKLREREEAHRQEIDELKDQFSQVMQKLDEFQRRNTKEKNELKAERNVYKDTVLRMEEEMSYMRLEIKELKQKQQQQQTRKEKDLASPPSDLLEFGNPDKDLDLSIEVMKKDLTDYIGYYPSLENYDEKDGEIFYKTKKTKLTPIGSQKSAKKTVKSVREDLAALFTPLKLSTVVKTTSNMEVETEEEVTDFVVTGEESKEHEIEEEENSNHKSVPEIDFTYFETEAQTLKPPPTLMEKLLTQAQQSAMDSSSREKPSKTAPELRSILNISVPLSQEIIDGYLKITHESKPKRSFYIFDSNAWPLIETGVAEVLDASVLLGKENIILPMFVSLEDVENPRWQLLRNTNKIRSHWVLMVLVDESRKWDDKSQVIAYYFDSSGSQKTPKSFLPQILEYLSVCIFSTSSKKQHCLSKKYIHPVSNMPTLFDCTQTPRVITIPNQLSIYSSGVHLLFHIDKIISNPRSHLFEENQVKSLNPYKDEEFDRKFRGHIKQTFTDFYKRNVILLNEQNAEDSRQVSEEQVIERERFTEQPKLIKKNIRAKAKSDESFRSQTEGKKKAEKGSKIN
ncbi:MAG: hypothetical protein ACQUHE_14195 [Bacteroidia bacterium]